MGIGQVRTGKVKTVNDEEKSITEYQKEWYMEAEKSSEKLFRIAEDAITEYSDLNVVIVKRLPRFDRNSKDTLGIKSKLSKFANHVFDQLWLKQGSPSRIHIVDLNLECEEYPYLKEIIFGKPSNPDYDGINLYGPGASRQLTYRAVQSIRNKITKPFQSVQKRKPDPRAHVQKNTAGARKETSWGERGYDDHKSCPQALYQQRQLARDRDDGMRHIRTYAEVTRNMQYGYSVPSFNRFAHFLH